MPCPGSRRQPAVCPPPTPGPPCHPALLAQPACEHLEPLQAGAKAVRVGWACTQVLTIVRLQCVQPAPHPHLEPGVPSLPSVPGSCLPVSRAWARVSPLPAAHAGFSSWVRCVISPPQCCCLLAGSGRVPSWLCHLGAGNRLDRDIHSNASRCDSVGAVAVRRVRQWRPPHLLKAHL